MDRREYRVIKYDSRTGEEIQILGPIKGREQAEWLVEKLRRELKEEERQKRIRVYLE